MKKIKEKLKIAEKAKMLVDAVKFPPIGDRGLDGYGLDAGFIWPGEEFVDHCNRETFLVVQIETPEVYRGHSQRSRHQTRDGGARIGQGRRTAGRGTLGPDPRSLRRDPVRP